MDRKVKLGIIGIGNMGSGHAANIMKGNCPELELVAIAEVGVVDGHANMFDLNRYLAVKDMGQEMLK